jgi:hypothetical protein
MVRITEGAGSIASNIDSLSIAGAGRAYLGQQFQTSPDVVDGNCKKAVFSISMPVKGGVEYLPLALASAALQDGLVELALLDASDGDVRVRSLAEQYTPLIAYRDHCKEDGGQSAAIQEGWDNTQGMFVGWLNSDDYLLPGALAQVKAVFDARPEVDVVYGHAIYVNEKGDFERYFPSISNDISTIYSSNIICQPACFIRRTALDRVGGLNPSLEYAMDWDLWIRLYKLGCKFHMVNEPLAVVCDHANSKTNTGGRARFREIERCLIESKDLKMRIRAKLGFEVYGLLYTATPFSLFIANSIRKVARAASLARKLPPSPPLFGLEPNSNLIKNRCHITMTWFGAAPASHVSMVVDRPGGYYICDRKEWRPWKFVGPKKIRTFGFNGKGMLYTTEVAPVSVGRVDYIVDVGGASCRLLRFSLHQ